MKMSKSVLKNSRVIPFPGSSKPKAPPAGLKKAGRRLWSAIQAEYFIDDAGGIAHLTAACRAEDDLQRMRQAVHKDGDVLEDRFGQKVPHPLLAAIRGMEAVRRQALNAMNLDVEPLRDKPGRPGGT